MALATSCLSFNGVSATRKTKLITIQKPCDTYDLERGIWMRYSEHMLVLGGKRTFFLTFHLTETEAEMRIIEV